MRLNFNFCTELYFWIRGESLNQSQIIFSMFRFSVEFSIQKLLFLLFAIIILTLAWADDQWLADGAGIWISALLSAMKNFLIKIRKPETNEFCD